MLIWPRLRDEVPGAFPIPNNSMLKSEVSLLSLDSHLCGLSRLSSRLESRLCRSFCRSGVYRNFPLLFRRGCLVRGRRSGFARHVCRLRVLVGLGHGGGIVSALGFRDITLLGITNVLGERTGALLGVVDGEE